MLINSTDSDSMAKSHGCDEDEEDLIVIREGERLLSRNNPTNTTNQTTFQLNTSFIHSLTYRASVECSLTMCIWQQTAVGCTGQAAGCWTFTTRFDKQAGAIVFHIYNLTGRGAELKQLFMGEKNVCFIATGGKEKEKKKIQWSVCLEHRPPTRWWLAYSPDRKKAAGCEVRSGRSASALLNNAKQ